ncbi:DUF4282 domain-containing protein [Psychrobacter sp. DAB_AL32B]|uniref:DUF4282 domain-containing protein n=1 Tax=Psychrobacter sp. DAB_AL32B TaxID=1028414 RepID=UPI000B7CEE58|nr:DUF4282 domain-containing protein [Psychrobacter sp. DAB_AL32B]OXL19697.1 hypothetical protein CAN34_11065 [Psychrobacter sp. DAB_AL32B]
MNSLLSFESFITPKVITILYWLILFAVFVGGVSVMFSGMGAAGFFAGLFVMIIGGISTRIYCELIMVIFRNNEYLKIISKKEQI